MSISDTKLASVIGETGLMADGDWVESKDQDPNGDVRLIQLADVGDGEYINKSNRFLTSEKAAQLRCTFLEPGDILVSRMADPIGRACIFPGDPKPCVAVVDICVIRPDSAIADAGWLKYAINSRRFRSVVESHAVGATRPRISGKNLRSIPLLIPPLAEQRRIVDLLARAEGIVRLRREAERKAAELIPALFLDIFGDPATNPKGWVVAPLATLCDKCSTADPRKTPQAGFTYIDIAAIDNDRGNIVEPKALLGADAPSRARQIVNAGDVLVSTVRPNLRGSAMVPDHLDGQICSTGFCVLRPKATTTSAFIFALARSDWFVDEMMKKVRGAQYPAVTDKDLFNHPIPVPPFPRQQEFSARLSEISSIQNQQYSATASAIAAFDAMLAGAFAH